ncbi:MAG: VOC family protein [Alkalibacterium sp.]|nr:VOC family protein [Alkalibacterium sp.]
MTQTELKGIHHVTAITSSAEKIIPLFTDVLGMRLVKKTVNQDDIQTYHLFFADDTGSPGTDMTFFDYSKSHSHQKGTDSISRVSFRVPSDLALLYWEKRLSDYHISHHPIEQCFGRKIMYFEDFDQQQYALVSDENNKGIESGTPWGNSSVPVQFAITGLGPVWLTVSDIKHMRSVLESVLHFSLVSTDGPSHLYECGMGGNGASLIITEDTQSPSYIEGHGGIHHVAFRVDDQYALDHWINTFDDLDHRHSGFIDRFYFQSLYAKLYDNILFEFATEGPGFLDDQENSHSLGTTLALPPALESEREAIEAMVRPIDTSKVNTARTKDYLGFEKE